MLARQESLLKTIIQLTLTLARLHIMGSTLPVFTRFDNPAAVSESPTKQLTKPNLVTINWWLQHCITIIIFTSQVWLTGGAFIMGGGSWFGPDYWMIHNIILVKTSYWSRWFNPVNWMSQKCEMIFNWIHNIILVKFEMIFMEAFFKAQRPMLIMPLGDSKLPSGACRISYPGH